MRTKEKCICRTLLITGLVFFSSFGGKVSAAEKSQYAKAVEAYQKYLKTTTISNTKLYGDDSIQFKIVDMNGDEIPELIVNTEGFYGLSQTENLYTFFDGKVKFLGSTGNGYYNVYAKGDLIMENTGGRGDQYVTLYSIREGKLKEEASLYSNEGWAEKPVTEFKIDNKKVSEKAFLDFIKKHTQTTLFDTVETKYRTCSKSVIDGLNKYETKALSETEITLEVGKTQTLRYYSVMPKFTWTSSDSKVATVDKNGKITAKKVGSCTITVNDGKTKKTCKVTIKSVSKEEQAYMAHIKKYNYNTYKKEDGMKIYSYAILDIDGDGVKELIVSGDPDTKIYTYVNGKMKKLDEFVDWDNWFFRHNKKNHSIIIGSGDAGGPTISILTMKNNKLISNPDYYYIDTYNYLTNTVLPESSWTYYKNKKKVTGYELKQYKDEISGTEIKFTRCK